MVESTWAGCRIEVRRTIRIGALSLSIGYRVSGSGKVDIAEPKQSRYLQHHRERLFVS